MTSNYYDNVLTWTANNQTADLFPIEPSVEELNSLFASSLNSYKAIGDQLIYTPAKFKKLFGAKIILLLLFKNFSTEYIFAKFNS